SVVFAFRTEALSVTYFEGAAGSSASAACRLVSKTEERSRKKRAVLIGGFFIVFVLPANAETIIGLRAKKDKRVNPAFSRPPPALQTALGVFCISPQKGSIQDHIAKTMTVPIRISANSQRISSALTGR